MKVILFGTATVGQALYEEISPKHEVIAFADNNASRWGTTLLGVPICKPEECLQEMEYDAVVIASLSGFEEIVQQCLDLGVPETKIDKARLGQQLESRKVFLHDIAELLNGYEQEADVAEAGVYIGDFAKWINAYFPNRTLHLFDTFEGFDERDIATEVENNYSVSKANHLSKTSVELVMSKMTYPEQVQIHKGYFPETAEGIDRKFCFVNLDMDLYQPTYSGLHFFQDKMTEHGVILVHDYYNKGYRGAKAAVEQFLSEQTSSDIVRYPIGDGVSIMLAGRWK